MGTCVVRRISIPVNGFGAVVAQPTVLLVTIDGDLRLSIRRALEGAGYHVLTAAHAGHAVLACLKGERIDLLLAELVMDEVSGPWLAERLRRHCPDLQALYFADAGTPQAEGLLVRPFTRDDLLARLGAGVEA
jgi:CheY-like chemotaxis protein